MEADVLDLSAIDPTQIASVGGKAANLATLARVEGVRVPAGFCVTTGAFHRVLRGAAGLDADQLTRLSPDALDGLRPASAAVRAAVERIPFPPDLASAITARVDPGAAYAVRSSATAEDAPSTSFAGQHDTFLDVVGPQAVLDHIRRCWASGWSERAIAYRHRSADQRPVQMAVVVQRMVPAEASGVLFTADPVSGDRRVACVESVRGLGDALVSGRMRPDTFAARGGEIRTRTLAGSAPSLSDAELLRLVALGRVIEAYFGRPQDIEWCLANGEFHIVQSRPITTLFPVPTAPDAENRVYVSVGHQQMMTDPMKPLGLSLWQLTTPRPMAEAGGRLFVDVTQTLAVPASRDALLAMASRSDPLIGDALRTLVDRGDFVRPIPGAAPIPAPAGAGAPPIDADPALVRGLMERTRRSLADLAREIESKSGPALLDFILVDLQELRRQLFDPQSTRAIMAGMEAAHWLDAQLSAWLGENGCADIFAQSVRDNVTSEMGLDLLRVADAIRPYPEVVAFLIRVDGDAFLDELPKIAGGRAAAAAIQGWLDAWGMRGPGEIDITRPRWRECPSRLLPAILGHVRNLPSGEAARRITAGLEQARAKEQDVLARLRALPDGEAKAGETRRMIERVRTFAGYREFPKYGMVCRYFIYKRALHREAARLVEEGVLGAADDIHYLSFAELHEVVRTRQVDERILREREQAHREHLRLTPPRVLTSDGEAVVGSYRREDAAPDALVGLAVSAGIAEGRARVILDMADADLSPGDILVTVYTDPGWTALFVGITGLVTEVGGRMTHGAVIAREYGLPAVVGVVDATRRIRDGQRIRVDGTRGWVEVLEEWPRTPPTDTP